MSRIDMFKPYVNEKAVELVNQTLLSGWVGEGPRVKEFEEKLKERLGANFAVALNSGTSALHLALLLAGTKPGDEVITTAQTMLATTNAILMTGAKPVYVDIEYNTGNMLVKDIPHHINDKTSAILPVDWGGYPCDYDALLKIGLDYNLPIIEDAAHALGASYKGRTIGSVAPFSCFSFQAIKHLTTGDGGLLTVSTPEVYEHAIQLRWFGINRFKRIPSVLGEPVWNVTELGYKYHMNDVAAAIGLGNLEDFDSILKRRHGIVAIYREKLGSLPDIQLFERRDDRQSADWLFSIHVDHREEFCRMMHSKDIMVSVVHLRIDRNSLCGGAQPDLVNLARFTETHVSLPLHPFLSDEDIYKVCDTIRSGW